MSDSPRKTETAPARLGPVDDRILALDVVRGFAAFGILMVNIQTFGGPYPLFEGEPWTDLPSQVAYAFVDFAFVSKFFPLFSLLFGIGLTLQLERAAQVAPGDPGAARTFAIRRLGGLFAIGLVHVAFFSTIDILVQYAFLGALLVPARKLRLRALPALAALALLVPVALGAIASALSLYDRIYPGDYDAADFIRAYGHGTLAELWAMRLHEIRDYYGWVFVYAGWEMLAMILLGAWAVRSGLVTSLPGREGLLRRLRAVAFGIGVPAAAAHAIVWITTRGLEHKAPWVMPVMSMASALGEPSMAVGYATSLALLVRDPTWASRLAPIAKVGRLALSSYVLQSIVMSLSFFSFGLGGYGLLGPFACIAYVVAVYSAELVLASLWARRFRFGPLEAAWRAMTYGRWPAMRTERP